VNRRTGVEVAKIVGLSREMDVVADKVLDAAQMLAARHRQTGSYMESMKIEKVKGKRGVVDRLIVATDPQSISIEYGHVAEVGEDFIGPPRWVPGQHIMGGAAVAVRSIG